MRTHRAPGEADGPGSPPVATPDPTSARPTPATPARVAPGSETESGGPAADAVWPRVLSAAGPRIRGMLDVMSVKAVTPRLLTLAVPSARAAIARDHLDEITRLVQETGVRGMSISLVEVQSQPEAERGTGSGPGRSSGESEPGSVETQGTNDAAEHPLVKEAIRVFGAKVVHVEPKRGG